MFRLLVVFLFKLVSQNKSFGDMKPRHMICERQEIGSCDGQSDDVSLAPKIP